MTKGESKAQAAADAGATFEVQKSWTGRLRLNAGLEPRGPFFGCDLRTLQRLKIFAEDARH